MYGLGGNLCHFVSAYLELVLYNVSLFIVLMVVLARSLMHTETSLHGIRIAIEQAGRTGSVFASNILRYIKKTKKMLQAPVITDQDESINESTQDSCIHRKTIIMGHRGGNFGPENSLKNFRGACSNQLEGVEFDVWLTKDDVPIVMHGGDEGQLSDYGMPDQFVFERTFESLQTIDIGEGE